MPKKPHSADALSFTRLRPKSEWQGANLHPRCWWSVTPSGDYAEECTVGTKAALEYLAYIEGPDGASGTLGHIVMDMPNKLSGIEIGFLALVEIAAKAGRENARSVARYWARAAAEAELEARK